MEGREAGRGGMHLKKGESGGGRRREECRDEREGVGRGDVEGGP